MNSWGAVARGVAILVLLAIAVACQPLTTTSLDEERDPNFLTGKSRANMMDYKGAVEAFEKALSANPQSASAHKELGLLHYQRLNDHAAAIYHFQKLLLLRPKDPHADIIRQHIIACKQELASTVSLGPVTQRVQREIERLAAENTRLLAENSNWQTQVAGLRQQLAQRPSAPPAPRPAPSNPIPATPSPQLTPPPSANPAPPTNKVLIGPAPGSSPLSTPTQPARTTPAPAQPRTHTIRPGETPYSIARRYQVSPAKLLAANRGINPRQLRVGQVLRLPPP